MFEEALERAIYNSEWNVLSRAQRKCLLVAVAAERDDDGCIKPWHVHLNARTATSKAMRPYLQWVHEHDCWRVTDEAIELVEYVLSRDALPTWHYLCQRDERGFVVSIMQTRDQAFAELLSRRGWQWLSEGEFHHWARNLSSYFTQLVEAGS